MPLLNNKKRIANKYIEIGKNTLHAAAEKKLLGIVKYKHLNLKYKLKYKEIKIQIKIEIQSWL